jgi:hypothetical protein
MNTKELLAERGKTHGDFSEQAAYSQSMKALLRTGRNWDRLSPIQREVLELTALKISRILHGDLNHQDHWDDIAGYTKLVSERLAVPPTKPLGVPIGGQPPVGAVAKPAMPFILPTSK